MKHVLLLKKYIFHILRQDSTVKSTNVLKQLFNIKYYIILIFFHVTWKGNMHYIYFCTQTTILNTTVYIYIRILYRRPSRWPSDIETCWNIRDKTYIICADGILFLVITHLSQSVCLLLYTGHGVPGQATDGEPLKRDTVFGPQTLYLASRRLHLRSGH